MWESQCDRLCGLWQIAVSWAKLSFFCGNKATRIERPVGSHIMLRPSSKLQYLALWLHRVQQPAQALHCKTDVFTQQSLKWCHVCFYRPPRPNCLPGVSYRRNSKPTQILIIISLCKEQHMFSTCTVHVQHMFGTCSVHVQHVFGTCSVHVQHVFGTCSVNVQHMLGTCSVHVQRMFGMCSVHVRYVFSTCSVHVQHMFGTCSAHVRYAFSACSAHVRYVFSTCSTHVQYMLSTSHKQATAHTCNVT